MVTQLEAEENAKKQKVRDDFLAREQRILLAEALQMLPFIRHEKSVKSALKNFQNAILQAYEMGRTTGEEIGKGEI